MVSRDQLHQIFRYCLALTDSHIAAEDLLRLAIETTLSRQDEVAKPCAHVRTAARRLFVDQCRHERIAAFAPPEDELTVLIDETDLEQMQIDPQEVPQLLRRLSAAEREVLYLWAVEGYTAMEIAMDIGVARSVVLARLYCIRETLKCFEAATRAVVQVTSE